MNAIPLKIVLNYHENLIKNKNLISYLFTKRGINEKTIVSFEIGYDAISKRFTIPIKNSLNEYVNIRKWSSNKTPKICSYAEGFGSSRLFPIDHVKDKKKNLIICEGEWDCLLLNQHGFNAITNTCGVSSWNDEWNKYLIGRNISIIYDCDKIGKSSAKKIANKLMQVGDEIKIIDLGLEDKEDITDWFIKYKKKNEDLSKLIKKTELLDNYHLIDLADGMNPKLYNKKIKFYGIVCGKDLAPYLIPKKVEVFCSGCNKTISEICPLKDIFKINAVLNYDDNKDAIIQMVGASNTQIKGVIRKELNLPHSQACRNISIKVIERLSIEDVSIIPEVDFKHERINEKEYVTRKMYAFGGNVQTNQSYLFRGTTWADPRNQMGIHLVIDKKSSKDSISKFIIDEEVKEKLKIFQPDNPNDEYSIWEKLQEYCKDMSHNVTHIYGRSSVILATDIVFHSTLGFKLLGEHVNKGWLECAVVGDTRTGKTETIRNMLQHYKAGEFITSGENTTLAGLLGGAQQHAGRWTLTWGKWVLNTGRGMVIDEADNLKEKGIIGELSGVRSSGMAEIVKIQTQRTMAKTRVMWIANPIKGKVKEHNYGLDAIVEVFGKQQDIARLDFALVCGKDDVNKEAIKRLRNEKHPHKYTSDLCHARVMWVWNRKVIEWETNAEDLILDQASYLGNKYSSDIPLVIDVEIHLKLARIAISIASMMYSTDEIGEKIIVKPAHVLVANKFLQKIYDEPSIGYKDFSRIRQKSSKLKDTKYFDDFFYDLDVIEDFLDNTRIEYSDIEDIFGYDRDDSKKVIKELRKRRALKKISYYYKKTPSFIGFLKSKKKELENNNTKSQTF